MKNHANKSLKLLIMLISLLLVETLVSCNSGTTIPSATNNNSNSTSPLRDTNQIPSVFNYVINTGDNTIGTYSVNEQTGALTLTTKTATEKQPYDIKIVGASSSVYVPNYGSNTLSCYSLNSTGNLTLGSTMLTGSNPISIAINSRPYSPSQMFSFLYIANSTDNTISMYIDEGNCSIYPLQTPTIATGKTPHQVIVSPDRSYAYAINYESNSISIYNIEGNSAESNFGGLTLSGTINTGAGPTQMVFDVSGKYAYVINQKENTLSLFQYESSSGALVPLSQEPSIATGRNPDYIAANPFGKYIYVANVLDNSVSIYSINNSTGILTAIGSVNTGTAPNGISFDPSGQYAYVTNYDSNTISTFTINQYTGLLTAYTGAVTSTGHNPGSSISIHLPAKHGYLTNWKSNIIARYNINNGDVSYIESIPTGTAPTNLLRMQHKAMLM